MGGEESREMVFLQIGCVQVCEPQAGIKGSHLFKAAAGLTKKIRIITPAENVLELSIKPLTTK